MVFWGHSHHGILGSLTPWASGFITQAMGFWVHSSHGLLGGVTHTTHGLLGSLTHHGLLGSLKPWASAHVFTTLQEGIIASAAAEALAAMTAAIHGRCRDAGGDGTTAWARGGGRGLCVGGALAHDNPRNQGLAHTQVSLVGGIHV